MISTLDDMHIWVPALGTGKLLTPATQAQRLQIVDAPGLPQGSGYGLGIFNVGGWIGHDGSLPGYQTIGVYLPEKQTTLVVFLNTDIKHQRQDPSAMMAQTITTALTPDHIFKINPH
jgi:D-alanyl-D-alanine carboxypeptidase